MLENKQKIAFNEPELQEVTYGKIKIKVKPYLSLTDQLTLLSVYLEEYFSKEQSKIIESEYKLMFGVLDLCTDIDVETLNLDGLLSNYKIWEDVRSKVKNYGEFRALLARTVDEIKENRRIEKSLGSIIESLFDRLSNLLNSEISPETIEKTQNLLKQIENSPVFKKASEIYKEK